MTYVHLAKWTSYVASSCRCLGLAPRLRPNECRWLFRARVTVIRSVLGVDDDLGGMSTFILKAFEERIKVIGYVILREMEVEMLLDTSGRIGAEIDSFIDGHAEYDGKRTYWVFALGESIAHLLCGEEGVALCHSGEDRFTLFDSAPFGVTNGLDGHGVNADTSGDGGWGLAGSEGDDDLGALGFDYGFAGEHAVWHN